jgi:mono/diheme cytochrome c family protein
MINRTNTVLAVLLVVVVIMTAAVGVDYSRPNIEVLPDMKYTPAWEAFAANPNFPSGRTMQAPVPGTIRRGQLPLYYAATKEDAVRAGEELANPYSQGAIEAAVAAEREAASASTETPREAAPANVANLTPEAIQQNEATLRAALVSQRFSASVERGGEVYRTFCISCHGPKGAGDGPVPQRGFPPPPSMLTGKSLQMKDGQLFHILTYGQGSMTPFSAQLSRDLRWDVINYVRDLQSKAPPLPDTTSTDADATAIPESPSVSVKPATEPAAVKPDNDKDVNEKRSENEQPETPRNQLRDRSSDNSPSASSGSEGAQESTAEGARK